MSRPISCFWLVVVSFSVWQATVCACPFCSAPVMTLAEQRSEAQCWVVAKDRGESKSRSAHERLHRYEVLQTFPPSFVTPRFATAEGPQAASPDSVFLLFGWQEPQWTWSAPISSSRSVVEYLHKAPGPTVPAATRLRYALKFLEHPDATIADDAYAEFANSDYVDIKGIAAELPRESLRKWLAAAETPSNRRGLYGLLLGLCGEPADARFLKELISADSGEDIRLGIDGIMGGYLLLTGEEGLSYLERTRLAAADAAFTETFAACQALRFAWDYAEKQIPRDAVRRTMRAALKRAEVTDLVIADLARWKDWELQPQLMEMYGDPGFNAPRIRRAVVRFMHASTRDTGSSASGPPPHVARGERYLADLRDRDPELVAQSLRFIVLPRGLPRH